MVPPANSGDGTAGFLIRGNAHSDVTVTGPGYLGQIGTPPPNDYTGTFSYSSTSAYSDYVFFSGNQDPGGGTIANTGQFVSTVSNTGTVPVSVSVDSALRTSEGGIPIGNPLDLGNPVTLTDPNLLVTMSLAYAFGSNSDAPWESFAGSKREGVLPQAVTRPLPSASIAASSASLPGMKPSTWRLQRWA